MQSSRRGGRVCDTVLLAEREVERNTLGNAARVATGPNPISGVRAVAGAVKSGGWVAALDGTSTRSRVARLPFEATTSAASTSSAPWFATAICLFILVGVPWASSGRGRQRSRAERWPLGTSAEDSGRSEQGRVQCASRSQLFR